MASAPFSSTTSRKLYCLLIASDLGEAAEQTIRADIESRNGTFIRTADPGWVDQIDGDEQGGNVNFVVIAHGRPNSDGNTFYARSTGGGGSLFRSRLVKLVESKFPNAGSIGIYAGVCGGAVGSSNVGGSRVDYSANSFFDTTVDEVLQWLTDLGLHANP
jgi:hypothetical protein